LFGKGFAIMDAGTEPIGMYLRRPLTDTPVPNFDQRWVCIDRGPSKSDSFSNRSVNYVSN